MLSFGRPTDKASRSVSVTDDGASTATRILKAARSRLLTDGYAALSTRWVAKLAGVPLSQIHYHFKGKQGMVLALLEDENRRLVERQRTMYGAEVALWKRYEQACDFLEEDLASGYVRVLQEMIAAGWSEPYLARPVLRMLQSWFDVLEQVAREAESRFGTLGPFSASDVAGLIGLAFLGGEAVILLGDEEWGFKTRSWLRSIGTLIRRYEEN
jgi:AcrR family transcriptional regulator